MKRSSLGKGKKGYKETMTAGRQGLGKSMMFVTLTRRMLLSSLGEKIGGRATEFSGTESWGRKMGGGRTLEESDPLVHPLLKKKTAHW